MTEQLSGIRWKITCGVDKDGRGFKHVSGPMIDGQFDVMSVGEHRLLMDAEYRRGVERGLSGD